MTRRVIGRPTCEALRLSGTDTTAFPYRRRRAALESVFTALQLSAP
jgi:ATP-dependent DNA ligase